MRPRVNAVKIALLQINPVVGDLAGNARLIAEAACEAGRKGATLAVYPEPQNAVISLLIDSAFTELAVRTLHTLYGLDKV